MNNQNNYKHCCVIDQNGNYITFVLVLLETDETGTVEEKIQYYTLQDGQQLIDTVPCSNIAKPRWNRDTLAWQETASPEEIAEWEQSKPIPPQSIPTPEQQRITDLETALAALAYGGVN